MERHSQPRAEIAVVGSGPSGFYAAEALLKHGVRVALIERLPVPFGLVRYGVAPDHPKLKTITLAYERVAQLPHFDFFGNVEVGKDISVRRLAELFDAVIFAQGACGDRKIGIQGEDLRGCHGSAELVGWYNGHPDQRDHEFDLSTSSAVIVGNGNVALDIARILSKPPRSLAETDISDHALRALAQSAIRDVHIVGRRGPKEARFSATELRELGEIDGCAVMCDARDLPPETDGDDANLAWFRRHTLPVSADGRRRIHFHFFAKPALAQGVGRLSELTLERTAYVSAGSDQVKGTGEFRNISAGLLFRAIGYRGTAIEGLPFDEERGIVPTVGDRVVNRSREPIPGLYATGWIKRGPSGIIGTNRADSVSTVRRVMDDLGTGPRPTAGGVAALRAELILHNVVDFHQWHRIDKAEVAAGKQRSKSREKFTRIADLLSAARASESSCCR